MKGLLFYNVYQMNKLHVPNNYMIWKEFRIRSLISIYVYHWEVGEGHMASKSDSFSNHIPPPPPRLKTPGSALCLITLHVFYMFGYSSYRRLPARRDLFWEDYARSSSRKKVTWIEMIITPKIMAYFWQFSFCIHKNIQVFIWKRSQSQFSLITGEKLRKNL